MPFDWQKDFIQPTVRAIMPGDDIIIEIVDEANKQLASDAKPAFGTPEEEHAYAQLVTWMMNNGTMHVVELKPTAMQRVRSWFANRFPKRLLKEHVPSYRTMPMPPMPSQPFWVVRKWRRFISWFGPFWPFWVG